jgi:surface protein
MYPHRRIVVRFVARSFLKCFPNTFASVELAISFVSNISQWDVSNLEECSFMFRDADNFNIDLSTWNIAKVTVMSSMFQVRLY